MLNIDNKYTFGDLVYLKTDQDQYPRIVTNIQLAKDSIIYKCCLGEKESWHYDFELNEEPVYNPALK